MSFFSTFSARRSNRAHSNITSPLRFCSRRPLGDAARTYLAFQRRASHSEASTAVELLRFFQEPLALAIQLSALVRG